jgi:Domain of unknown function (DUF5615)
VGTGWEQSLGCRVLQCPLVSPRKTDARIELDRRETAAADTRDAPTRHDVLGGHAEALRDANMEAVTVAELGLAGRSDLDIFAAAGADSHVLLTENVADFARIAADHLAAGHHHAGVLIALSSRFSRRPPGATRSSPWCSRWPTSRSMTGSCSSREPIERERRRTLGTPASLTQSKSPATGSRDF